MRSMKIQYSDGAPEAESCTGYEQVHGIVKTGSTRVSPHAVNVREISSDWLHGGPAERAGLAVSCVSSLTFFLKLEFPILTAC